MFEELEDCDDIVVDAVVVVDIAEVSFVFTVVVDAALVVVVLDWYVGEYYVIVLCLILQPLLY